MEVTSLQVHYYIRGCYEGFDEVRSACGGNVSLDPRGREGRKARRSHSARRQRESWRRQDQASRIRGSAREIDLHTTPGPRPQASILERHHRGICAPEATSAKWCAVLSPHVIIPRPQLFSPASCCCCWLWSLSACVFFALPCPFSSVARPRCHVTSIYQGLCLQTSLQYLFDASPVPIVRFSCLGALPLPTMPASPPAAAWPRDHLAASPPTAQTP